MEKNIHVLYISYTLFGDECATGQTLKNIFFECKKIKILQYCLDYTDKYHNVEEETVFFSKKRSPLFYLLKSAYRNRDRGDSNHGAAVEVNRLSGSPVVILARAFLDILPKRLDRKAYSVIDSFNPDVIYTTGENITTLIQALKISKRYNAPIVMHMMDNNEDSVYAFLPYTKLFRSIYLSLLGKVYKRSCYNIAISPKMAKEFSSRHKVQFDYAMNCITETHESTEKVNNPLRFVFSGGLHGGRANMLKKMGEIISSDKWLANNVSLDVFTSPANVAYYKDELSNVLNLNNYVPQEEMFENLGEADVLVHCESFEQEEIEFFRYSMSTKIPEYLSVGRPILCFGPMEICTVEYLADNNVGCVATNPEELRQSIELLAKNRILRNEYGKNALKLADDYLAYKVAEKVERVFSESLKTWKEQ